MIKPVDEDGLGIIDTGPTMEYRFLLYVKDTQHTMVYPNKVDTHWIWRVKLDTRRRSLENNLPGDDVAGSVLDLLNKNDNTAGMPLLEYLTKMGFDVSHIGFFPKLKRWVRRLFK